MLIRIEYTKHFVNGLMKDLTYPTVAVIDQANLQRYKDLEASSEVIKPCVGSSSYYISGLKYNPTTV